MFRHILPTLLAAGLCLSSVCCSSPVAGERAVEVGGVISSDSLALIEGKRLLEEKRYDLARERLEESALSASAAIRTEAYLHLNALEMRLENYDMALVWLEKYHVEAMKLFRQALDAGVRIDAHREATARSIAGLRWLVAGVVLVVGVGVFWWFRRAHSRPSAEEDGNEAEEFFSRRGLKPSRVEPGMFERWLVAAEVFAASPMRAEIAELESQPADRHARVLSHSRQEALDAALDETFAGLAERLREACPALTAGDVKLCCLSLAGISTWGRALCFGSTETNIIKQRKHKLKRKLASDNTGRELFEFIFSLRG